MERYNALENSFGEHKIKYTLQCGTCRGSFTKHVLGNCKGAVVMFTDIFEMPDESDLERMEFDHLRLIFDDEGLIIEFLNDAGEAEMAIDQYWFDIDRERLIVGIEIVEFEEEDENPFRIPCVDWDSVPVDTKVIVTGVDGSEWKCYFYKKASNNSILVYRDGKTSWTSNDVVEVDINNVRLV